MAENRTLAAAAALMFSAACWGIFWYPYRLLHAAGLHGAVSTALVYGIACVVGGLLFWRTYRISLRPDRVFFGIALTAGWANLGFTLGTIEGEVMRVLLLFYLSPVWTVLLSWWLLGERLNRYGYLIVVMTVTGAVLMLGRNGQYFILPQHPADWYGLSSGVFFALSNVLSKKAHAMPLPVRAFAIWFGIAAFSVLFALFTPSAQGWMAQIDGYVLAIIAIVALFSLGSSLSIQYGLAHFPVNQATVILLFELIVAAVASYFLAHEVMRPNEWLGGVLIIAGVLFSNRMARHQSATGTT
jgi:drug/metabolite transporter (DMT)-like permease